MRLVLCLAAFLLAGPASAQEKKPYALSAKEIADGWLMLFDGESTFGWKIVDGTAVVKDGKMIVGGLKATRIETTSRLGDCQVDVRYEAGPVRAPGTMPRLDFGNKDVHEISGKSGPGTTWNRVGNTRLPIVIDVPAGETIALTMMKAQPKKPQPLFDGKTLTGWKVFPGEKYKSKFAVTPRGELSVTNGPGDLQTEKAFGDFILQFECFTNGKALNSGVFFRCLEGQYQQGYEAQIQNAYLGDDRTKPIDFGTGAIYRRVAARKVVSNDNEWFTMTVAADGKHISTWVNGYQAVDWTDDRPAEENARKGYRAGKGHISIQGHDPTTDILFRNIRIAELGGEKK